MLSTPSDLRNPPARDTGSLLAQLLDFPDDDDANAQPLSAEQLAQQLAFFSEAEFNFESAPPAAPAASTYLQRTGLVAGADKLDAKQPAVGHQPHSQAQSHSQSRTSSLQPLYHGQVSLQSAGPAFALQPHQQLFSSSIQPPVTQPSQVVWGPNGTAFILQPAPVPGQPAVMVPLQLASTLPTAQPLATTSAAVPSVGATGPSSTSSIASTLVPSSTNALVAPFSPPTLPSVLSNTNVTTPAVLTPSHIDTGSTNAISNTKSVDSTSTALSRTKRSSSSHLFSRATQAKESPSVSSPAPGTQVDQVDDDALVDDNDNETDSPTSKRPRTTMDEEKRRRNTEASARFRLRKKAKEQALERAASELAARLDQLERRTKELETENAWLRGILVDRDGHDRAATAARYAALAAAAGIQPPHSAIASNIPAIPPGFSAGSIGLGTFATAPIHTGGLPVSRAVPNATT